jgi:hypothetical protein
MTSFTAKDLCEGRFRRAVIRQRASESLGVRQRPGTMADHCGGFA